MSDHLRVDGQLVAHTQLDRYLSSYGPADEVYVFYDAGAWRVLALARHERYDDDGTITRASAELTVATCASVGELAEHVGDRYGSSSWGQLLDVADCSCDPDLRFAWATHRFERDFDAASIYVKDLATTSGLWSGDAVPAPGRALDGWEDHHVTAMAGHLTTQGFEVLDVPLAATTDEPNAFDDPVLGALRVRRYGYDGTGIVRVDAAGEVFIRLHHPDDGAPAVVLAPEPDDRNRAISRAKWHCFGMPGRVYEALWGVAVDQYGYVTTDDARALGVEPGRLAAMAHRGRLERVAHGVYRFRAVPATDRDQLMEATLWPRGQGVISHDSALELWELCDVSPAKVHVSVPVEVRIRRLAPAAYTVHSRRLAADDVTRVEGIPVVTVRRAILDGHERGLRAGLLDAAVDTGTRTGQLTHAERDEIARARAA